MIIYPDSVLAEARHSKLIGCAPPSPPSGEGCLNCGDIGSVFAWRVTGGPYKGVPNVYSESIHYIDDVEGMPPGWYTGHLESYPCPACSGNKNAHYLIKLSGLEDEELTLGLGNFWPVEGKVDAHDLAAGYIKATPYPVGFVTLYGANGVGKSFLLKILANELRQKNIPVAYRTMGVILAECRSTFDDEAKRSETSDSIINFYSSVRVLLLDEVDRVNPTRWALDTVFQLLDNRYRRMDSRLTVLATNKNPNNMGEDFKYLTSRMNDGLIIPVTGVDMRLQRGEQFHIWRDDE